MNSLITWRLWARPAQAAPVDKLLVENLTARRVVVEPNVAGAASEVVLGPFEVREMLRSDLAQLKIADWQRQNLIRVTPCPASDVAQDWWGLLQTLMVWFTAIALPAGAVL